MQWQFINDIPIYQQIIDKIKRSVLAGDYPPGGRLPSVRDMAATAGVNPNTMQRALSELEKENLIFVQRTNGRFVTEDKTMIANLRKQIAENEINRFILNMNNLGYQKAELIDLMQSIIKEMGTCQ